MRPFPVLTNLDLLFVPPLDPSMAILPDGFLGGSALYLQKIVLINISFPALPSLLSSASDLVHLQLHLTHSTSISLEAMVTGLAVTTKLKALTILSCSLSHQRAAIPPTRVVLPALTHFQFRGDYKYLEDLVAPARLPLTQGSQRVVL